MHYFSLLYFLFAGCQLLAQSENLVPNASFEQYKMLPDDISQGRKCLVDWVIPNEIGAGDYYHDGCKTRKASTHKNYFGKQEPRTGSAYMGLCITNKFREYIQVKLKASLVKDSQYKIVFYISCADKSGLGTVNEFNALFSDKPFKVPNNEDLLIVPKVKFTGEFNNKKEWVELSAIYTATGSENYLTFGSFTYEENGIKHGQINGVSKYAHYYIDDVSVTLIDKPNGIKDSISVAEATEKNALIYSANKTYVFDKFLFESGKSELPENNYPELDDLIVFLNKNPHLKIRITGHTDNIGNESDNKKLSYNRANAIKSYLIKKGINERSISIEGKGDSEPLISNETEEGRKINRRVEITLFE